MAHQVNSIDYGDYRYKVGDLIKISSSHEYLYLATTGSSRTNCPNISKDTRKITQIWESDSNSSISNPIITAYHSGSYRYGGGAIRPEQIAIGSGGQKLKVMFTIMRMVVRVRQARKQKCMEAFLHLVQ